MNILNKLLQGGIPKKELFIITPNSNNLNDPSVCSDLFIYLNQPIDKIKLEVSIKRSKQRTLKNPTIVFDSCAMYKNYLFDEEAFGPVPIPTENFPYSQESMELGPKAEFKKTPIRGFEKEEGS